MEEEIKEKENAETPESTETPATETTEEGKPKAPEPRRQKLGKRDSDIHYMEAVHDQQIPNASGCYLLQKFHKFLNRMFFKIGFIVALRPSYFIMIPIFISLLAFTGVQQMIYEKDPELLFSPTNGRGRLERDVVETLFPVDYSNNFDPSRITRMSHFGRLLISATDNETMFRTVVWDDLVALDDAILNITIEWEEDTYTYEDICARRNEECLVNQVFNLNDYMYEIENGSMVVNYPVMLFPLVLPFAFGGPVVNESEGVLLSTKAIAVNYWFADDDWKQKERAHIFEGKLLDLLDENRFENIHVARFVSRSLEDELDKNAQSITPYLGITIVFMVSFSIISVIMGDWVRSKIMIGAIGVLSAALATMAGFGFLMYIGVPFIGINMAAPFLMLGIGIDDMFVVLSAWHRTKIQEEVPIRLAKTYSEAAVSITITSLTNMLSFFIGSFTPFPAVYIFCVYTGVSIFFTYVWFITFFGGCLAVAGYQEKKNKHSLSCKPVVPRSQLEVEDLGCCYKFWCSGGINPSDPWNPEDNKTHVISVFFRDYFGKALNMKPVKALVIFTFILYLCGAIYGCTKLKEGLERKRLTLDTSYLVDFFETEDEYFRRFAYRIQVVINEELTYSNNETEKKLLDLHTSYENLTYIGPRMYSQSWIRSFYRWLNKRPHIKQNITDEVSFIRVLKDQYLNPSSPEFLDVLFNEDETKILASRFIVQGYDVLDTNADKDMMSDVRRIADESPFNVIAYHPYFVFFDQYLLVKFTSIQTISLAAVVMMAVSLIFIPNPLCSLWVAFSIISIEVGVIGYMSLWNVNLDSVSMINLIMCIGFSVDFSAHISYAYMTAKVNTPDERVRECLFSLGFPVVQGGFSTIIGVMVLALAPSYIFTTFFKIVFLVVFFGIMHGTLLLPVMLSLLGPGSCSNQVDSDEDTEITKVIQIEPVAPPKRQLSLPAKNSPPLQIIEEQKAPGSTPVIKKVFDLKISPDEESLGRDLGLGSSGSSSRSSSMQEIDSSPGPSDAESNTEEIPSRKNSDTEAETVGKHNEAFVPDEDHIQIIKIVPPEKEENRTCVENL